MGNGWTKERTLETLSFCEDLNKIMKTSGFEIF